MSSLQSIACQRRPQWFRRWQNGAATGNTHKAQHLQFDSSVTASKQIGATSFVVIVALLYNYVQWLSVASILLTKSCLLLLILIDEVNCFVFCVSNLNLYHSLPSPHQQTLTATVIFDWLVYCTPSSPVNRLKYGHLCTQFQRGCPCATGALMCCPNQWSSQQLLAMAE